MTPEALAGAVRSALWIHGEITDETLVRGIVDEVVTDALADIAAWHELHAAQWRGVVGSIPIIPGNAAAVEGYSHEAEKHERFARRLRGL